MEEESSRIQEIQEKPCVALSRSPSISYSARAFLTSRLARSRARRSKKRVAVEDAPAEADESTVSAASLAGLSKNQKKKLAKKQKTEDSEVVIAPAPAAAAPKKEAAVAKKEEKPAAKKEEKKVRPRSPRSSLLQTARTDARLCAQAGPKTQVIAGGLEITDSKVGTGAAAKSGNKVGMRYIGKLENGKVRRCCLFVVGSATAESLTSLGPRADAGSAPSRTGLRLEHQGRAPHVHPRPRPGHQGYVGEPRPPPPSPPSLPPRSLPCPFHSCSSLRHLFPVTSSPSAPLLT